MNKAVIFDIDDTLYESKSLRQTMALYDPFHIKLMVSEREVHKSLEGRYFENSQAYYDVLFNTMATRTGRTRESIEKWYWETYLPNIVKAIGKNCPVRPGVQDFLSGLRKKGYMLAVMTDYALADVKLQTLGIDPALFDKIYVTPEWGGLKPCMLTFHNICRDMGVEFSDAVMVGDRVETDGGALAAGLQFCHLVERKEKEGDYLWPELILRFQ